MSPLAVAPHVRQVEIPGCDERDYRRAVLWCPECVREPHHIERCSLGHTHRVMDHGPYLNCNRCFADLIWVVIDPPETEGGPK